MVPYDLGGVFGDDRGEAAGGVAVGPVLLRCAEEAGTFVVGEGEGGESIEYRACGVGPRVGAVDEVACGAGAWDGGRDGVWDDYELLKSGSVCMLVLIRLHVCGRWVFRCGNWKLGIAWLSSVG